MIQAAFFNISRFLFFTKHSIIDCSCKSSNYKFVVWPFKKTKQNNFIPSVLGVFFTCLGETKRYYMCSAAVLLY